MKVYLCRIVILAAVLTLLSSTAEAQKSHQSAKKNASKKAAPAEQQKTAPAGRHDQHSAMELAIVEEINSARSEPQKFVGFLEEYRKATRGNLISLPNRHSIKTIEGVSAIEEAIGEVKAVSNLRSLELSERLSEAARMQLRDLQEDASLGHTGKNGSTLKTRLSHFAKVEGKAGENICYRGKAARDVVMIFLIDDGVKSRMHRKNVMSSHYKKMGVACGTGKNQDSLCVTVFAENVKDHDSVSSVAEF